MSYKLKIKLNSVEKVEAILQEIYDDANRQLILVDNKMAEMKESTPLADETIDMKAKFGKMMHDFITDRDKALGRKMEVSKLMTEVLKHNGDVEAAMSNHEAIGNLDDEFEKLRNGSLDEVDNTSSVDENQPEVYITNKTSYKADKYNKKEE